jgi:predicted AlkP superfamily phosphohydrolase/phosphomutase
LSFKKGRDRSIKNLCPSTKAFVLDPARIYLHYKGKYPAGSVEPGQKEDILKELQDLLANFEKDGKKIIRDIYRPEQIYSGKCFDNAPDLILVSNQGFDLKAKVKNEKLFDKGLFTGKHTQDTAFLVVKGLDDESIVPEVPSVSDIVGIAEKAKN